MHTTLLLFQAEFNEEGRDFYSQNTGSTHTWPIKLPRFPDFLF